MSAKMEEGFRQQAQHEIMQGLKNKKNARHMVQKDLEMLKEEMKNMKMSSTSTVCSEGSTGLGLGGAQAKAPCFGLST